MPEIKLEDRIFINQVEDMTLPFSQTLDIKKADNLTQKL